MYESIRICERTEKHVLASPRAIFIPLRFFQQEAALGRYGRSMLNNFWPCVCLAVSGRIAFPPTAKT